MNYEAIYSALIERARQRIAEGYTERHHIVPRCMGGGDESENIVRLKPEEHFLAHQLLVKLHPSNRLLVFALNSMSRSVNGERANNKQYGWIRRRVSAAMRQMKVGNPRPPEVRAKLSAANKGRPLSAETRAKMSAARKGRKHSPEHCAAIAASLLGKQHHTPESLAKFKAMLAAKSPQQKSAEAKKSWETRRESGKPHPLLGRTLSQEHKSKIGKAGLGRKFSAEARARMKEKALQREERRRVERNLVRGFDSPAVG